MKVLVVDDSKAMRMIVRRALRQTGLDLDVSEAENGQAAFHQLTETRFDFVLSDWNMPEMNGYELLQRIKAEGIPVKLGFVTSESTDEMRSQARSAGAEFLISKPFTPEILSERLSPYA